MDFCNTTTEGIKVKVGQVWKDLDYRARGRTITLTRVESGFAYYDKPRKGRIRISRMHKSSTGYAFLRNADEDLMYNRQDA